MPTELNVGAAGERERAAFGGQHSALRGAKLHRQAGQRLIEAVQIELARAVDRDRCGRVDFAAGGQLHQVAAGPAGVIADDQRSAGGDRVDAAVLLNSSVPSPTVVVPVLVLAVVPPKTSVPGRIFVGRPRAADHAIERQRRARGHPDVAGRLQRACCRSKCRCRWCRAERRWIVDARCR